MATYTQTITEISVWFFMTKSSEPGLCLSITKPLEA
jgi:hypothetical protein